MVEEEARPHRMENRIKPQISLTLSQHVIDGLQAHANRSEPPCSLSAMIDWVLGEWLKAVEQKKGGA